MLLFRHQKLTKLLCNNDDISIFILKFVIAVTIVILWLNLTFKSYKIPKLEINIFRYIPIKLPASLIPNIRILYIFRYQNYSSEKIEECSYYNQNYSILAKNGYNWSMNNLDTADSKPCQYYSYSTRESVVTEVC